MIRSRLDDFQQCSLITHQLELFIRPVAEVCLPTLHKLCRVAALLPLNPCGSNALRTQREALLTCKHGFWSSKAVILRRADVVVACDKDI